MQKTIFMTKSTAQAVCGGLTSTSKMPCKSYSLPTESCITGYAMAKMPGSICNSCYANKGFYKMYENTVKPAQHSRLDSVWLATENEDHAAIWVDSMVTLIGQDKYFRWHDSGDLQSIHHLTLISLIAQKTPHCMHWLPTREYSIIKDWLGVFGQLPDNLIVRLSAMYPDKPVKIPASLANVKNVTFSNVHTKGKPIVGDRCIAPDNKGSCGDCRKCWTNVGVSYELH